MLFGQFFIDKIRSLTIYSIYWNIFLIAMSLGVLFPAYWNLYCLQNLVL